MQTSSRELVRAYAELIRVDRLAPRYHFVSPQHNNFCFDPNGAIFWNGRYHLFFIYQDAERVSGPEFWQRGHGWGHASSADLIHWMLHPTALAAEPGDPEGAIFSGCALVSKEGVPTIVYHGVHAGTCVATAADDGLITWKKDAHNPVIHEPKKAGDAGWDVFNVFDPCVWREGDTYYAILGGQVKPGEVCDVRDTAYLFRSDDLTHWEYLHPFFTPNEAWTRAGDDCACPKFFPLGDRHMLLCISHATGARYYLGDYRDQQFFPDEHHAMNWPGGACFAPETLVDGGGRRLMWAWAVDQRADWWLAGVSGVLTLPRVLSMSTEGVKIEPAAELESLRKNHRAFSDLVILSGAPAALDDVRGDCLELSIDALLAPAARLELAVLMSPDGAERTTVCFDRRSGELSIDTSRSSMGIECWRPWPMDFWRGIPAENIVVQRAALALRPDEPLRLRVFVDRSIVEVFANGRLCMTQRVYPSRTDSVGVALAAEHGEVRVRRLDAWVMDAIEIS